MYVTIAAFQLLPETAAVRNPAVKCMMNKGTFCIDDHLL